MAYESVLVNFMNIRRQDMMVKKYSTSATIRFYLIALFVMWTRELPLYRICLMSTNDLIHPA